jgi:transposase, IS30 family
LLSHHGGIVPAASRRSLLTLTLAEQEQIARGIACGSSIRENAKLLGRAASTFSRKVTSRGGRPQYRANEADQQAWESALRPKAFLLSVHEKSQKIVASHQILNWSPEQVPGWLKVRYPGDQSLRVSHGTIYRSLFIQARGVLKKELIRGFWSMRRICRSQQSRGGGQSRVQIVEAISIRERPAEIEILTEWAISQDRFHPDHSRPLGTVAYIPSIS